MPTEAEAQAILDREPTVSAKIRALNAAGFSRSRIAALVERSYQQVRQVLVDEERRAARRAAASPIERGVAEEAAGAESIHGQGDDALWLDVAADGSLRLPPALKAVLGLERGGRVLAQPGADGTLSLIGAAAALRQAQEMFRRHAAPGLSLSDGLIAERREAARRDDG